MEVIKLEKQQNCYFLKNSIWNNRCDCSSGFLIHIICCSLLLTGKSLNLAPLCVNNKAKKQRKSPSNAHSAHMVNSIGFLDCNYNRISLDTISSRLSRKMLLLWFAFFYVKILSLNLRWRRMAFLHKFFILIHTNY